MALDRYTLLSAWFQFRFCEIWSELNSTFYKTDLTLSYFFPFSVRIRLLYLMIYFVLNSDFSAIGLVTAWTVSTQLCLSQDLAMIRLDTIPVFFVNEAKRTWKVWKSNRFSVAD